MGVYTFMYAGKISLSDTRKTRNKNVSGKVDEMCKFYGVGVTRYQWKCSGTSRDTFIIYNENTKEINLGIKLILVFGNQIPIKNCSFSHP